MIMSIIRWSIYNRGLVLLATFVLILAGILAIRQTPIDAIPDLSDVQVIVKTSYPGQAPQVVEDQITYPLSTAMLSVPGAKSVRGFSFFGDSYIYIIFNEDTDLYWARSRVLEYLSQAAATLPESAKPQLGPDATGVGWIYIYALADKTGQHDLSHLTSLQNWFLKFELQSIAGVSEVASVGGMIKQYQVEVDPLKLQAYSIPLSHVQMAIQRSNQEIGASVIELAEAEYMIRASGYIEDIDDLKNIPIGIYENGIPLLLKDIAQILLVPQIRRGIAELNGEGEVVGGIVVMRSGENAQQVIAQVKSKLESLQKSLPDGVEIISVYDRSQLIEQAVNNLGFKLIEEFSVVILICMLFLFHFRSSMVIMLSLPIGILTAFIIMQWQGLNANIMSLGGIAIAIGAMTDGAIVMVENMHKHLEKAAEKNAVISEKQRWQIVYESACEVGPALFFSLLIITVSFMPVFTLEAQEGKLFAPLAFTKTYAMAATAGLAITLVPVLMGYFIRGKITAEKNNSVNRHLIRLYIPVLKLVLAHPKKVIIVVMLLALSTLWPLNKIGSEFIPPLNEGDLMYMPTTYPAISIGKARQILQQTDQLIRTIPEVKNVFGKVGRADTATDPAPLTMIETFIQLKPTTQWREGMTIDKLKSELDQLVQFPGLTNAWVMPIKTRIDMLATGIKTPVGIKISGPDLSQIESIGQSLEGLLNEVPGTLSVYSERVAGGRYIKIDINRQQAARYGLTIADVQQIIATTIGGKKLTQTTEGLERYPVNLRYPQNYRQTPQQLKLLPIVTNKGEKIVLGDVAKIYLEDGAPGIKSENARLTGWTLVDIEGVDVGHYVEQAKQIVDDKLVLPAGYAINWSGQYEYMMRAKEKLMVVIPLTLGIILVLLFLNFKNISEVIIIVGTLPLAMVGSFWLMHWLRYYHSVAVSVGFIALAGVAVEIAVIMLVYLNQAFQMQLKRCNDEPHLLDDSTLKQAILDGAGMRIRPVMMTALTIIVGLVPIFWGDGAGSEVMRRIAAPMVGGMISVLLLVLFVLPVVYYLWRLQQLNKKATI
ncbi:efflux RND transporter permease subunit [Aliikangiella maris]|uniref:CusA/CzcA family heavy metal efflux RND transporter n=2 Tax=Aliikangiella maris TaxID=3162458 RepID=A0ABV3MPV7_9GAMM